MRPALAMIPPVIAFGLLSAGVRPVRAAAASLAGALVVAATAFPTPVGRIGRALWEVAPTCAEVAAILFGGVLLNELMSVCGANARVADWLVTVCREPSRAVVLILLGVTPFAESVTGFGVGVVIATPLLCRLGLAPVRAAIVALLGLVIVPWGALGPGTLVAAQFTGVDLGQLGVLSAVLSIPVFLLCGASGLIIAVGVRRARGALVELAVGVIALSAGVWAVNVAISVPLAGVLGSLFSIGVLLGVARMRERRGLGFTPWLWWALRPYAALVAGLLCGRAMVAMMPGTPWGDVVSSPALWLLVTCGCAPFLLSMCRADTWSALRAGVVRWRPVASTTVLFLVLGALLTVTGMSGALAAGAAKSGAGYPVVAPFIGAIGGFLTGSNAGANAMFAASQATAAEVLGLPVSTVVAVQNVAASLTTMASIPRVVLAAGLARESGTTGTGPVDQGSVLRSVLLVDGVVLLVLGAVGALLA